MESNKILGAGLQIPDQRKQTYWIKAVTLAALSVASFGLTWWLFAAGLAHVNNLLFWFWPLLSAAAGVSFLALLAIVDQNQYLYWGCNLAILVLYILVLPKQLEIYLGGIIFVLFVFLFEKHVRDDEHSRADFSLHRILRSSINFMVYGLLIVVGFNIYAQIKTSLEQNPERVYQEIGHYAASGLNYVPSGIGNFNPNQTFDDFVVSQAQRQEPMFAQASPSQKKELADQVRNGLEQKFNLKVSGNPLLGDVVAGAVADKVKQGAGSYSQFFPAIFAVLIVVLLSYVGFLFRGLASAVCWVLYRFLLMTKFFRIEKVQVEVDKLQI